MLLALVVGLLGLLSDGGGGRGATGGAMATGSQPAAAGVQLDRGSWVQPRFGLGGYFPEFIGAKHAPYSLLAEANFSVALMGSDVSACKAAGLGCISLAGPPSTKGVDEPALWGYNVGDEPGPPPGHRSTGGTACQSDAPRRQTDAPPLLPHGQTVACVGTPQYSASCRRVY